MKKDFIEVKAKTVDEAIFLGLQTLELSLDQVDIEVLNEGFRGLFGLGKKAVVKMSKKKSTQNNAEVFLNDVFARMEISATAYATQMNQDLIVNIEGDHAGVLIGRRGETLDALQYLTSLVINKELEDYIKVTVDTENYRQKREDTLARLAKRIAGKVSRTGRRVALEPMNPYERRILHSTLQNDPSVETLSEGEEPNRRVVVRKIRSKKD